MLLLRPRYMQAALRAGAGEVARGFSTGFVVWAGTGQCPSCAPVLNCAEVARCPDCVCGQGGRVYAEPTPVWSIGWLLLLGGACLAIGYLSATMVAAAPSSREKKISKKNVVKTLVEGSTSSDDGGSGASVSAARARARAIRG